MAFSPDGKILASCSNDQTIRLWDVATGKPKATFDKLPRWRGCWLTFSPNGKLLAMSYNTPTSTISDPADLLILDARRGKILATLKGHKMRITCKAFSPDGRMLASGDGSGTIILWKLPANFAAGK